MKVTMTITETPDQAGGPPEIGLHVGFEPAFDPNSPACQMAQALYAHFIKIAEASTKADTTSQN